MGNEGFSILTNCMQEKQSKIKTLQLGILILTKQRTILPFYK